MSADVKLYTSEDLRSRAVTDVVLPSRLRATVEALERVTKERDEALARWQAKRDEMREVVHKGVASNVALREERDEARDTLSDLRDWPCEGQGCEVTLRDVEAYDSNVHTHQPGRGIWFCGDCWDKALAQLKAKADEHKSLRAETLKANENLQVQRDAALAACAEFRAALEFSVANDPHICDSRTQSPECSGCRARKALSSDAGRGWVSPEEHEKVVDAFESNSKEASEVFEVLLARGLIPNVKPGPRLAEIVSTMVSPEAFDAALREVADAAVRAGSPKNSSRCADGGHCDHYECREDRMFAVTNRRLAIAAIIAAAKAQHGGGR